MIGLTATALGFSGPANGAAPAGELGQLPPQDTTYLMTSHQLHLAEVISGTRASTEGTCPLVRELGAMLVADHTRLDATGVEVALPNMVPLPLTPTKAQVQQMWDTGIRIGRDFDLTWLRMQEDFHHEFRRAGAEQLRSGTSESVTTLARDAVPSIDHHLQLVREALNRC
ncbi:DUF4142 domain-containing protein [Nocardia brasiliensis]|uniref:DUF4142 domain-containing protein n=1 Tax=Nocardia brasiliensis TaxID=37326 RepID=UPI002458F2D7|nr:DUF4142 domain-containing protein [Nocardia brasiliensis]